MTANIIDGKELALQIRNEIAQKVKKRTEQGLSVPGLAVIQVRIQPRKFM